MPSQAGQTDRTQFYERFADQFDAAMNRYEVNKRLELVFGRLLPDSRIRGTRLLDAGCGTGLFSQAAVKRGAKVTSMDVGERLLAEVARKCDSTRIVGDVMAVPFEDASFDVVLSTEVIEHVADPRTAVRELVRVLRPGGTLAITTPNRVWHWSIALANRLGLRPYEGLENWVRWSELRRWADEEEIEVEEQFGFNAFPFIHPRTYPVIDCLDRLGDRTPGRLMINMALLGTKPGSTA